MVGAEEKLAARVKPLENEAKPVVNSDVLVVSRGGGAYVGNDRFIAWLQDGLAGFVARNP